MLSAGAAVAVAGEMCIRDRRHIEQSVSHIDVLPTICDYNSISPRHLMDGCSLRQLLEDGTDTGDRAVYIQYDGNASLGNYSRCVIDGNYKLIVDFFKDEIFLEVYDLDRDRLETDNLLFYEKYDEVAERLIGILACLLYSSPLSFYPASSCIDKV